MRIIDVKPLACRGVRGIVAAIATLGGPAGGAMEPVRIKLPRGPDKLYDLLHLLYALSTRVGIRSSHQSYPSPYP